MTATTVLKSLQELANPEMAAHSQRFFKTAPGEYGAGDVFLGIRVPVLRQQTSRFGLLPLTEVSELLHSEYHEARLLALFLLVKQFNRRKPDRREEICRLYLDNLSHVNNWDLVDSSAHYIVGAWLLERDKTILYELARGGGLWERRVGIMSTYWFIKNGQFDDALAIAEILLQDLEDLIHKAVGWMLREVGNRASQVEREFLHSRYRQMPRTMLRYAIEKFPEPERQAYLHGTV
ncbi:MAG: DNA alkylation repair protein [Candidatus Neomarinimicrobiota bacterium]